METQINLLNYYEDQHGKGLTHCMSVHVLMLISDMFTPIRILFLLLKTVSILH